jgi:small subunit ribosomal protein S17
MADEEKNETTEETPAEVSDTSETPEVEETSAEVSDTSEVPEAAETPAAEEVSDTSEVSETKKARSRRHVPRPERRTRTKLVREKPKTRKPITRTEKPEAERGRRQERRGVVVSDKGDKTIVVKVDVIKSHQRYKKVVRRSVKFHAHDEQNTAGVGDTVRIVETRPLSKNKRWRLAEIVEKAK